MGLGGDSRREADGVREEASIGYIWAVGRVCPLLFFARMMESGAIVLVLFVFLSRLCPENWEHTEASIQGFSPGTIGTQGKPRASAPPSEKNGKATHKVPRRASRRRRHPASQHPLAPPRSPAFLRRENLTDRSSPKIQSLVPPRPSESATPGSLYPFPSEAGRAVIPPVRIRPPDPR